MKRAPAQDRRLHTWWMASTCSYPPRRPVGLRQLAAATDAGSDFARGLRTGVNLATRIADGDHLLAEQLRELMGDDE